VKQRRLDEFGCFAPGGLEQYDGECTLIDFQEGDRQAYPVKGMDLCSDLQSIPECTMQDMIDIAQKASLAIGVYVRVDMFLDESGKIYVQVSKASERLWVTM
jgi:hypothetical protein